MYLKRLTCALLAAILCGSLMTSCNRQDSDAMSGLPTAPDALAEEVCTDYTSDPETVAYVSSFREIFPNLEESAAENFTLTVADGQVTVTGYVGSGSAVRVPSEINGQPVVAIADGAFAQNTDLHTLYLPDSITSVGSGILTGCSALQYLRTPLLGADAGAEQYLGYLYGSERYEDNPRDVPAGLKYLELGGSSDVLADYALFDCNDLVCLTLPETVKSIGTYALYNCNSLLEIFHIGEVVSLADHALDSCASLTRLDFGEGLVSVGLGALEGCVGLRTLTLPFVGGSQSENTYLGYVFGATVPDFAAGYYPPYLSTVVLLPTCTALGNYAFYNCTTLCSVVLPDGLTSVGVRAFAGCSRLEQITLPRSVQTIRENAFFGCLSLQSVRFGTETDEQSGASDSLTSLGINAFYHCVSLREISLPSSLAALPASCFAGCVALESVNFGGVREVGKNAFRGCTSLTTLVATNPITFASGNGAAEDKLMQ